MGKRVGEIGYAKYAAHRRIYMREYYRRNRNRILAQMKSRGWKGKGIGQSGYAKLVRALLRQRDGDMCWLCGLNVPETNASIDHVLPKVQGGADTPENIRLTHLSCNLGRPKKAREESGRF